MSIKSLDDLMKAKEQALAKRSIRNANARVHITVAMGTCGIAAGARDAMKVILDMIEENEISDVLVTQTGCIGLCAFEPIVEVQINPLPKVTYGMVTPERARAIMLEHVIDGQPITEWQIAR
jgi:NADP-reducing hydrogenase subunit HndB